MQRVRSRMNIRVATKSGEAQVDSSTLHRGKTGFSAKKSRTKKSAMNRGYNTGKYMYGYCS